MQDLVRAVRTGRAEEIFIQLQNGGVLVALADLRLFVLIVQRLGALGAQVDLPAGCTRSGSAGRRR